jgi:GT2 family glycosyltransferase
MTLKTNIQFSDALRSLPQSIHKNEMKPATFFTIIIPVAHSLEDLRRCLNSLEDLNYSKEHFLVVLVDSRVVQGVELFLKENLPGYKIKITPFYLPDKSKVKADWYIEARINEARNYAMQMVPGHYYVFTADDCTFEPDWLNKFGASLSKDTGAVGGPDLLPEEMGLFPKAIDCILNSYLGSAGMHRGQGRGSSNYYPRKENILIPSGVIDHVGKFSEEFVIAGEMEIAKRIRNANFNVVYLPDNPVWHWRKTSFLNFCRTAAYTAFEKVLIMRKNHAFFKSTHFFVLLAAIAGILVSLLSLVNKHFLILSVTTAFVYFIALFSTAISSAFSSRSLRVGFMVLLFIPVYHASLVVGITRGALAKIQ